MNLNPIAQAPSPARASTLASAPPATDGAASIAAPGAIGAAGNAKPTDPSLERVDEAVASINRSMSTLARGLEFSIDAESRRTVVKVVDQQTKELIRQIPTEEALEIAQALEQSQGLLIKQTA